MAKSPAAPKSSQSSQAPQSSSGDGLEKNGNRPVHTIRYQGCEAAIWKNTSDKGDTYTVTLRKSWRVENEWHDSPTFLAADLPTLAKAINDAHSWIMWQQRRSQADSAKVGD